MFADPRNRCTWCSGSFGIQCYDCIFIKRRILSFKIILVSLKLMIASLLIAVDLLDTRNFVTFPFYFIVA